MAGVFDTEVRAAGVPISALIASMCRSAQRVTLADRTALYAQGEPANTLFLILDGFVKTSRICEEGTEITIELLKYGDIAGASPPANCHRNTRKRRRQLAMLWCNACSHTNCALPWKSVPVWRSSSPNTWPDQNDRLSGGCCAR